MGARLLSTLATWLAAVKGSDPLSPLLAQPEPMLGCCAAIHYTSNHANPMPSHQSRSPVPSVSISYNYYISNSLRTTLNLFGVWLFDVTMVIIPEYCHASTRLILGDHPLALEQLRLTATDGTPPLRPPHYRIDDKVHVQVFGLMELIPLLKLW
jgi:hypothetical protein